MQGVAILQAIPMPFAFASLCLARLLRRSRLLALLMILGANGTLDLGAAPATSDNEGTVLKLDCKAGGNRFDGIGLVNGGGATAVLLKDYPEPQRSQILDLVFKPKFGASVSALLVEIPGDGNSTQGSMPSHMRSRDDLDYTRGYTWWLLQEARKRNPRLSLDAAAWSAPAWIGNGDFWSQDAADYYVKWLQGLRNVYGLELDAIGCRNEKGVSYTFAKRLRRTLNEEGFAKVRLHAFDNWPATKLDFVKDLLSDQELSDAIDIVSAHVFYGKPDGAATKETQGLIAQLGKPLWNTEDHVYLKGFDCLISIVECFNENYIASGATRIVNWYDIAGVYPLEPYSEDPATLLAHWPWSGHYEVREALWGYAHYGQFSEVGWTYLNGGSGRLPKGGSYVTLLSPKNDYSIIIETKQAQARQSLKVEVQGELSNKPLCVWRSNQHEQFVRQEDLIPVKGSYILNLDPDTCYSISTTNGQQKGCYENIPARRDFPLPYHEDFESHAETNSPGQLPLYTADIEEVFERVNHPDKPGLALRQVIAQAPIAWAPSWQPYTILGDQNWSDYTISADIRLNEGDSAGVMGRIAHVGTGYGTIPKGYFLKLDSTGRCELVVVRGKRNKQALVGDAEQQALLQRSKDTSEGGEKILAQVQLAGITPNTWHRLTLGFAGVNITGLVDGKTVLEVKDTLYSRGMAGLMAGKREGKELSTPYFDNLEIKALDASVAR